MIITWWKGAKDDLDAIYDYYAELNQHAAVRIYNEILTAADRLLVFPEANPIEPMIKNEKYRFRSCVVVHGLYKIIYFVNKDTIVISHIWDYRRNPNKIRQGIFGD